MLIENIVHNLVENSEFFRKTFPHLKREYFDNPIDQLIFDKITFFENKYSKVPHWSDLKLLFETDVNISESDTDHAVSLIESYRKTERVNDISLLITETESWAQTRALELAILGSVDILQDPKKGNKGMIEELIKQALAVQFAVNIGHDYFKDAPARAESYMENEEVIMFPSCNELNVMMNGGLRKASMFIYCGRPNIGKTLILCDNTSQLLKAGLNGLYISGEMKDTLITKRVDANLLDITMDDLGPNLDKTLFMNRVKGAYEKSYGRLITKQYPAGTATIHHIRALIHEIKQKKGITIDFIVLDYLNLFASCKLPASAMSNTYLYVKAVAEEFRGLAMEFDIPIITATQINRSNANAAPDALDMTGISDSFGIAMTADFMCGIIQTPELFKMGKYLMKVIKSRFGDNINEVYTVGVQRQHMRLHDVADDQKEIPIHLKDKLAQQAREASEGKPVNPFDFGDDSSG